MEKDYSDSVKKALEGLFCEEEAERETETEDTARLFYCADAVKLIKWYCESQNSLRKWLENDPIDNLYSGPCIYGCLSRPEGALLALLIEKCITAMKGRNAQDDNECGPGIVLSLAVISLPFGITADAAKAEELRRVQIEASMMIFEKLGLDGGEGAIPLFECCRFERQSEVALAVFTKEAAEAICSAFDGLTEKG